MKKLFLSLSVVFALALASCGGSLESKKQELSDLQKQVEEVVKSGDIEKAKELGEKIVKLQAEIAQLEREEAAKAAQSDNDDDDE